MKVLRADQYITVPWRNGGGTTQEIAVLRDSGRHDDFLWRLSIATVSAPGPFSRFEGVDRTIALLAGEGMSLQSRSDSTLITGDSQPYDFVGEAEIACALLDGQTVDLNAMTRRGFYKHTMRRERFMGWTSILGTAHNTFVTANAPLELSWHGRDSILPLDTIADIVPGTVFGLYSEAPAEIFVTEIERSTPWNASRLA